MEARTAFGADPMDDNDEDMQDREKPKVTYTCGGIHWALYLT